MLLQLQIEVLNKLQRASPCNHQIKMTFALSYILCYIKYVGLTIK